MRTHRSLRPLTALVLAGTLGTTTGCNGSDLAQEWQLDRLRVLAVKATPAEPQPGDVVTFDSLIYVPPSDTLEGVSWFGCIPEGDIGFGCEVDTSILAEFEDIDPTTATPEELAELFAAAQEAGLLGFQPGLDPVWAVPPDALDGLTDAQAQEGVYGIINITALPEGAEEDDIELAFKRVPVSLADTPNHNPELVEVTASGPGFVSGTGTADDPLVLAAGKDVELLPVLSDDSVEEYTFLTSTGATETRTEEPYFAWYTEGGDLAQNISLPPYNYITLTAPKQSGWSGLVAVVVRDRRGGMDWHTLQVTVQ